METLPQHQSAPWVLDKHANTAQDNTLPVRLYIQSDDHIRNVITEHLTHNSPSPTLCLETNKYREDSNDDEKGAFRHQLISLLSGIWNNPDTTIGFLKLVEVLEVQGCGVFAGLIDPSLFTLLIRDFTEAMGNSGSKAFLHSFLNLAQHPEFLRNKKYNDAFIHPLLIALIAYSMSGAIRMTDVRGKDTEPISVNAQDNMLHIDNTPFREEFKILVAWEKGVPRGPTGQNFTFIPGTHLGNRRIRTDESGKHWSTENDSIFLTPEALENVFAFQKRVYSHSPYVVEVEYPEQPITVAFSAASLVHHRYRTEHGGARSCIIAAFHLASDNPGSLLQLPEEWKPSSITDMILGHQGRASNLEFASLLSKEASVIQNKVLEIMEGNFASRLVNTSALALQGTGFDQWKEAVISAPSTTSIKIGRNCVLTTDQLQISKDNLIERLTSVMSYDKHGLLDLKLYQDGREEIRKSARKHIFCLRCETISDRLQHWVFAVVGYKFTTKDILGPAELNSCADSIAEELKRAAAATSQFPEQMSVQTSRLLSFSQLLTDLGESINRCGAVETYISTTLFIFWAIEQTLPFLHWNWDACSAAVSVLRSYISSTLLVEQF